MEKRKKIFFKNIKSNEKGSITILVLTTMLVVVGVILFAYMLMMNKSSSQERELDKIQQEYNQADNIDQIYNGTLTIGKVDGSWDEEKKVNTPVIRENMELVKWDETQNKFVPDETNSSYDYDSQQWANAKVTIDGVESYFVWIPRYEYKITYYKDENKETISETPTTYGTIDIKFIKTSDTIPTEEGYIIHPAFTSNKDNGGWSEELPGIWVGKYESARSDSEGATQGTSTTVKIQPGVTSWRSTKIGDMYTYAKAYSTNLNSHMLKNSEWGAVAYLTESKYGRNGTEVTINDNSSYITADAGISANPEQSSTGNETGIYDLSGGAYEYVAAYYNGSNLLSNGSSFASQNGTSTEYATAYTGTSAASAYKPGDATYETSAWHSDSAYFVNSSNPFFVRGGSYNIGPSAGLFYSYRNFGNSSGYRGFRMCLAVK